MEHKQKRIKKTSNEQYQYMMNFLGEHKVMLKGKLSPAESTKVRELWMQLSKELNNMKGSVKHLQQWKRTFIEYKSKVKAKSRLLKGTRRGTAEAQLNETENLCLDLIGRISTEGDVELRDIELIKEGASTSPGCELMPVVGDSNTSDAWKFVKTELIDSEVQDAESSNAQMEREVPVTKDFCTPKSIKSINTPTHKTSNLKELGKVDKICESLNTISSAINHLANSNNCITESNNNLAASINNLANAIKLFAERPINSGEI